MGGQQCISWLPHKTYHLDLLQQPYDSPCPFHPTGPHKLGECPLYYDQSQPKPAFRHHGTHCFSPDQDLPPAEALPIEASDAQAELLCRIIALIISHLIKSRSYLKMVKSLASLEMLSHPDVLDACLVQWQRFHGARKPRKNPMYLRLLPQVNVFLLIKWNLPKLDSLHNSRDL